MPPKVRLSCRPLPTAIGYAPWVEEVWVNYLSNALKYGGAPPLVEVGFDVAREAVDQFLSSRFASG